MSEFNENDSGYAFTPFTYVPDRIVSASTTDEAPSFPPHGADDAPDESKGVVPNSTPAPTTPASITVREDLGGPFPRYMEVTLDLLPDGTVRWRDVEFP